MIKKSLIIILLILVVSKTYSQGTTKEEKQLYERLLKPDSTLTNQEKELKYKVFELYSQYLYTDGKKIYTDLKEDEFKKRGIPLFFYHDFVKGLEGMTKMVNEGSGLPPEQVHAMVKNIKENYNKMRKK